MVNLQRGNPARVENINRKLTSQTSCFIQQNNWRWWSHNFSHNVTSFVLFLSHYPKVTKSTLSNFILAVELHPGWTSEQHLYGTMPFHCSLNAFKLKVFDICVFSGWQLPVHLLLHWTKKMHLFIWQSWLQSLSLLGFATKCPDMSQKLGKAIVFIRSYR